MARGYQLDHMNIYSVNVDSKNELIHLLSLNERSLFIEDEYCNTCVLLKIESHTNNKEILCGLALHKSATTILEDKKHEQNIWFHTYNNVYNISLYEPSVKHEIELSSDCWELVSGDTGNIAAIHSLGATGIDSDGNIVWNIYGDDALNDFEVKSGQLKLIFGDDTVKFQTI